MTEKNGLPEERIKAIARTTRNPNRGMVEDVLRIAAKEAFAAGRASAKAEIPAELFDGMAVYVALGDKSGVSPRDVAAVLDATVRQIRKNRG